MTALALQPFSETLKKRPKATTGPVWSREAPQIPSGTPMDGTCLVKAVRLTLGINHTQLNLNPKTPSGLPRSQPTMTDKLSTALTMTPSHPPTVAGNLSKTILTSRRCPNNKQQNSYSSNTDVPDVLGDDSQASRRANSDAISGEVCAGVARATPRAEAEDSSTPATRCLRS